MVGKYKNVLLRKVDIESWDSDAWKQAKVEFGPRGIPYLRVYGTRGDLLGEIKSGRIEDVEAAVAKEAR